MQIDEQFMNEVGLGDMPAAEKRAFIDHATEELEVRIGQRIGSQLSESQLAEFDHAATAGTLGAWLDRHIPDYRAQVKSVFQDFKRELHAERQTILAA